MIVDYSACKLVVKREHVSAILSTITDAPSDRGFSPKYKFLIFLVSGKN